MKAIYWPIAFLCSCHFLSCKQNIEKEIEGAYRLNWYDKLPTACFYEIDLHTDSIETRDLFDFKENGRYLVHNDSLYFFVNGMEPIGYKIILLDTNYLKLLDGFDTLVYQKWPKEYLCSAEAYQLAGIQTNRFIDTLKHFSLIHFYKKENRIRIRLNDALKGFEDIRPYVESDHGGRFEPLCCMIGQGIQVSDLYLLYQELAVSGYSKTTLILAKSGKNRFEIFEDKFGLVSGSDLYSMNIDTTFYKNHPELVLNLSSLSDISDSTFHKLDDPYLIQIDPHVPLNTYIQIKEKVKKLAEQNGAKFQFIVPGID